MPFHSVRPPQMRLLLTVLVALSSPLTVLPTAATTREVTSLADPGTGGCTPQECTLREAIAAAQPGDTITFAEALFANGPGTITLAAGELVIKKDLTIRGPGQEDLAIHGKHASRVLRIAAGVVIIHGVTITGGKCERGAGLSNAGTLTLNSSTVRGNTASFNGDPNSAAGGGLWNGRGGILTLRNSTVRDNTAFYGGGLWNHGTLRLRNSTVRGNTASTSGGGLSNDGTLALHYSTVRGNRADSGGGLHNSGTLALHHSTVNGNRATSIGGGLWNGLGGTLTLRDSTVRGNTVSGMYLNGGGGGLWNGRGSTLTLHGSTVSGNTASGSFDLGGALLNYGTLTLHHSTVSGNTAYGGGGIVDFNESTVTLHHSTVSGNTALRSGGGLLNRGMLTLDSSTVSGNMALHGGGLYINGTVTLDHSTISGNTALRNGGGLYTYFGTLHLRDSIVAGNTVQEPDKRADCGRRSPGRAMSEGHNLFGADTGCPSDPGLGDVTVDPATVFTEVLGPLQDNGGPTWTHALLPGSPAIDAGDPEHCAGRDQRGVSRPQGAGCDIGAFELEQP